MSATPFGSGMPASRQIRTWQEAELNAAEWMRYWGFRDAVAQPGGPDGGVDVRATGALAQVKYQAAQVGRPSLQRLVGARGRSTDTELLFFTGSDYAATAVAYADEMDIALFHYALDGSMTAVNGPARRISQRANTSTATAGHSSPAKDSRRSGCLLVLGVLFVCAPFGSFGDKEVYTGPFILDALKFVGILAGCWLVGALMIAAGNRGSRDRSTDEHPDPDR